MRSVLRTAYLTVQKCRFKQEILPVMTFCTYKDEKKNLEDADKDLWDRWFPADVSIYQYYQGSNTYSDNANDISGKGGPSMVKVPRDFTMVPLGRHLSTLFFGQYLRFETLCRGHKKVGWGGMTKRTLLHTVPCGWKNKKVALAASVFVS